MSIFQIKEIVNEAAKKGNIKNNTKNTVEGSAKTFYDVMRKLSASINREESEFLSKNAIRKLSDMVRNIQDSVDSKSIVKVSSKSAIEKDTNELEKIIKPINSQLNADKSDKNSSINKNGFSESNANTKESSVDKNTEGKGKDSQVIKDRIDLLKNKIQNKRLGTQRLEISKNDKGQINSPAETHLKNTYHMKYGNPANTNTNKDAKATYIYANQPKNLQQAAGENNKITEHTTSTPSGHESTSQTGSSNTKNFSKKVLEGYRTKTVNSQVAQNTQRLEISKNDKSQINSPAETHLKNTNQRLGMLKDKNNALKYNDHLMHFSNEKEKNRGKISDANNTKEAKYPHEIEQIILKNPITSTNEEISSSNVAKELRKNSSNSNTLQSRARLMELTNTNKKVRNGNKNTGQRMLPANSIDEDHKGELTNKDSKLLNNALSINKPENFQEKKLDSFSDEGKHNATNPLQKKSNPQWINKEKSSATSQAEDGINAENVPLVGRDDAENSHGNEWANDSGNINMVYQGPIYQNVVNDDSLILQNVINNLILISKKIKILVSDLPSGKKKNLVSSNSKATTFYEIRALKKERKAIVDSMQITVIRKTTMGNHKNARAIYELKNTMLETIERFKSSHGSVKYKNIYFENSNDVSKSNGNTHKNLFENVLDMAKNNLSDKVLMEEGGIKASNSNRSLNVNEVFNRIVQTIVRRSNESSFTEVATVKLHPPRLGEIEVIVIKEGNNIEIRFKVSGKDAQDAIEKSIHLLSDRLNSQGFSVERIEVTQENRNSYDENYREDENQDKEYGEENKEKRQREQKKEGENSDDK